MIDKRIKEVEKLGFKKCIIPESNKKLLKDKYKLDIIGVKNIKEAEKLGFKTCIIPESNKKLLKDSFKLDIIGVKNIADAMKVLGLK